MAKKQTRRSLSLDWPLYNAIKAHAKLMGWSMSGYVTSLILADFAARGISLPEAPLHGSPRPLAAPTKAAPESKRLVNMNEPTPEFSKAKVDAAWEHALEHTRVALAQHVPTGPRIPKDSCWYCEEPFHPEQTPVAHELPKVGKIKLHAKCLRQISLLPGGIEP